MRDSTWVVTTKGPKWIGGMPLRAGGIVDCSVMYFLVSWFEFGGFNWYTGVYRCLGVRWSWYVKLCRELFGVVARRRTI